MSKKLLNSSCLNLMRCRFIIIFSKNNIKKYRIHYYKIIPFSFYLTTHGPFLWTKFLSKLVWRETFQTSHISLFFFVNFENLTVEFHVRYVLNIHIKFHSNWISFTFQSINSYVFNMHIKFHSNWTIFTFQSIN